MRKIVELPAKVFDELVPVRRSSPNSYPIPLVRTSVGSITDDGDMVLKPEESYSIRRTPPMTDREAELWKKRKES